MKSLWRLLQLAAMATMVLAFAPGLARADLIFDFSFEFSGGTPPVGPPPWMRATFSAVNATTVDLTLKATGLSGSEFVSEFYFNLDSSKIGSTSVAYSSGVSGTGSISLDAYKADGDGKYDILIEFPTGPPSARFSVGDTSVFRFTNAGGLTPDDFKFLSKPDGGHGPFYAAAHVQATGSDGKGSGWVAPRGTGPYPPDVPEPSTLAIAGLGALGLAGYGLRRRSR